MLKNYKSIAMMLFLGSLSVGTANATPAELKVDGTNVVQQAGTCTGVVKDANGEAVIGASVAVKGTTTGSITDLDGKFSIANIKEGETLTISYIGYTTQEVVWKGQPLNIVLKEDTEVLDEVVVLAYGVKQKRGKLTNSVSSVSDETLTKGSYGDPAQALVGAVAGLKVQQTSGFAGSTPSITLRGGTSYNGTGEPLVVVDGQIRTDGLSDLNSNDIESMEVMKDAGATAIYGARAANGVILVTTKQGKEGKAQINFNMKVGAQYYDPGYEMMDAGGYIYWIRRAYANSSWAPQGNLNSNAQGYGIGATELSESSQYNILRYTGSEYQQNLINNHGWSVMDDPVSDEQILYKGTDITDYNMQSPAISQEYNLSFSGGNERGKYYAGLGYYDADGIPISSFYKRYSFSFSGSYKIAKWLEASSIFNYNRANWQNGPGVIGSDYSRYFGRALSMPPTVRFEDEEGNLLLGIDRDLNSNFLFQNDRFDRDYQTDKFNMTQTLQATLFDGFTLRGTMAWSYSEYVAETFNHDYVTNQAGTAVNTTRSSQAEFYRYFNQTYNLVANYDKQFGDHTVSGMLGMEFWDKQYKQFYAAGQEAPTGDFGDLGYTSTEAGKRSVDSAHNRERIMSYFGRFQYDYLGRYILAFTFREDGYSRLINNRWGFFPGVSAGWIFSEENFYSPLRDIVNYGKLRASFGVNGSIDTNYIGIYTLHGAYQSYLYNGSYGFRLNTLPNPDLRWEKTRTAEVGLDLGFLNNRFTLGFTFYDRVTSDKYASMPLPPTSGWSSITNNNGKFRNRGIEIDINANLLKIKDFSWTLGANIAYNKNTVVQLPDNGLERNRQSATEIYTGNGDETTFVGGLQEGMTPYDVIVGYGVEKMVRSEADLVDGYCDISQGQAVYYGPKGLQRLQEEGWTGNAYELAPGDLMFEDINGDGVIDSYDRKVIGHTTPKWNGGFNTTFSWKGLSLYLRTDFGLGFDSYDGIRQWFNGCAQGNYNMTTDIWDSWTPENPNAKYPRYDYADQLGKNNYVRTSEYWITKGNYLAFRELQLSYTLPTNICNKFHCQGLTVSVTGQNLGYWTSSATPIPDYVQFTDGNTSGNGGTYALPRTVLFGLNITF
ncbi:MAG: TonB-dependent receptor [Candidatus Bacteroides intestinipullorum]|uniref:TonB-dependent receptor n=1 Tax=Candidatus Bacteroides intestinipullorum TaxID=2838471 RepID=A0A9E2KFR8_9BACE|nr:TonB-dependent receptor [Candidatus Bacteroides intestinipullorum]